MEITDKDKAIIDTLVNPHEETTVQYQHDPLINQKILAMLILDRHFLVQSMDLIKPEYFEDESHSLICSIVFKFFKEYKTLPSKIVIQHEIKEKRGNSEHLLQYLGELEAIINDYVPGLDSREYLMDKIVEFAKEQSARCAIVKTIDILKKKPTNTFNKIWELWREALTTDKGHDLGLDYFRSLDERYEKMSESVGKKDEIFSSGFPDYGIASNRRGIDSMLTAGGLCRGEIGAYVGNSGSGKCFSKGTQVLMYDGTIKNVEDIKVNDFVMGDDSSPRKVLSLHSGYDEMYDIIPVKGEKYTVNSQHILVLKSCGKIVKKDNKTYEKYTQSGWKTKDGLVEIPVYEYLNQTKTFKKFLKGIRTSISFNEKQIKIDPYILGVWLGDGSSNNTDITTMDEEVAISIAEEANKRNLSLRVYDKKNCKANKHAMTNNYLGQKIDTEVEGTNKLTKDNAYKVFELYYGGYSTSAIARFYGVTYSVIRNILKGQTWKHCNNAPIQGTLNRNINSFLEDLKFYNLINNKHVPFDYKINNKEVRLQILAGLLDTDGSLSSNGFDFINKNKQLASDVVFIARSVGLAAYIKISKKKDQNQTEGIYWRVSISGDCSIIPTRIARKKAGVRKQIKNHLVTGITVVSKGKGQYYGFETDGNHRFVLADFTIVHNSLNLAGAAAQNLVWGKKVCYITLEMSEDKIAKRFDSWLSEEPYKSLLGNKKIVIDAIRSHVKHEEDQRRLVIKHYPGGTADVNTFRAYLSQLNLYGFKPDMLIVDYVGEMKDIPGLKTYESRQLLVRDMRTLAQEENLCLLTAIQANRKGREVQDFDGLLEDDAIADSFGQLRILDACWSINKAEQALNVGMIYVIKHRDGISKRHIYYELNTDTLKLNEITNEEYKIKMANFRNSKSNKVDDVLKLKKKINDN